MPRKYSLKFGGTTDPDAPIPPVVLIGILLCCVIFCAIASGLIGYFGFIRETCKDKDDDGNFIHEDLCPPGKELKEATCEGECDVSTCCKEYNCNPPTSLPRGYKRKSGQSLSTTTFKSVSDFEPNNPSLSSKVECDTNYTGAPVAISCAGNSDKKWSLSGCDISSTGRPSCTDGRNPGPGMFNSGGRKPRTAGSCSSAEVPTTNTDAENRQECDSFYESGGGGRFCYYNTNTFPDSCVVYSQDEGRCTLPVG